MRNLILGVAALALTFGAIPTRSIAGQKATQPAASETQSGNQAESTAASNQKDETAITTSLQSKSATGKITAVSGDTFAIEVGDGSSKETMQFVTDSNTAKSGDLKVGSDANVQYHSEPDGKNTAIKVDIQG